MRGFIVGSFATGLLLFGLMEAGSEARVDSRDISGIMNEVDAVAMSTAVSVAPARSVETGRP
jgi:hypothetical protein